MSNAAQEQAPVEETGATKTNLPAVKFLASSHQLRIVSTYFDNMFKRPYTKTVPSIQDGLYYIDARDWNPDAMEIVLNVAHVQTGRLPRQATLAMLIQIFVIIDYYWMEHSIAVYIRQWLKKSKSMEKPTSYCTETMLWMFLSLIMRDWHVFEAMTQIAIRKASQPIQYLGLPFPLGLQSTLFPMKGEAPLIDPTIARYETIYRNCDHVERCSTSSRRPRAREILLQ